MLTGVGMDAVRDLSGAATGSLIAAVWQGALLAGAAALGMRMLPKTPAAVRFAIWFSVFMVVAALPFAGVWGSSGAAHHALAGSHSAWLTLDDRWSEGVLLLWAAVSVVRLVMLIVGAIRVRSLWKRATPIEIAGTTEEVAARDAFGRKIQICTSDEVDRPSVIGFFAPKILIPAWLVEKLTPEEMTHVVLHEAGHLRRADDWLNLLQKFALVVFPLNPALAWVERRLCFERELACDEGVLRATGTPKAYASCLTSLSEHRMTRRGMALVMGALGRESELGQRIRRILARGEHMRPAHARLVMGGAVCALLAGAVGLEHCPQLVGFSGTEAVAAKAPARMGLRYQDVVYRPEAARSMQARAIDTVVRQPIGAVRETQLVERQASSAQGKRPGASVLRPTAVRQTSMRHVSRNRVLETQISGRQPDSEGIATEWVVMTSWSANTGNYGARVVMTSIATGPTVQPSLNARSAPVQGDGGDALTAAPVRRVPVLRDFSPYAAVPVRGGWLVIQL